MQPSHEQPGQSNDGTDKATAAGSGVKKVVF